MHVLRLAVLPLMLGLGACSSSLFGGDAAPAPAQTAAAPAAVPQATPEPAPAEPAPVEPAPEQQASAEPGQPARWGALFVAGDHSITAFDNATRRFYNIMQGKPRMKLARLTSDPAIAPSPNEIASLGTLDESLGFINSTEAANCFLFMTSHGKPAGFYLSQHDNVGGLLPPRTLDWLLDRHCGAKPTVAIISACYSGIFLTEGMEQPNRIILTAARADRPSFGCSAEQTYTFYDECLIESWLWAYSWRELHEKTTACVAQKESELGMTPSEPQAYFGEAVAELPMP